MRLLLTGGSGYLGSAVAPALRSRGHEVIAIGRHAGIDTVVCDLADPDATRAAVAAAGPCDAVVHLAARAHAFRGLSLEDLRRANVSTTRSLLDGLRAAGLTDRVRFVLASSVAVYDLLDDRAADPRWAPYAASKLEAEEAVLAEGLPVVHVLRFAPIYDPSHLVDVAKRVYLPGTRIKVRLWPSPRHWLCGLEYAVATVIRAVESPQRGLHGTNVTDPEPKGQHELASWFPGPAIPVPTVVLRGLAAGLSLCGGPGRRAAAPVRKFSGSAACPPSPVLR